MSTRAEVAIAGTDTIYPITFDDEPTVGKTVTLNVGGQDAEYVISEIVPTGFTNSPPYFIGVLVTPKK